MAKSKAVGNKKKTPAKASASKMMKKTKPASGGMKSAPAKARKP